MLRLVPYTCISLACILLLHNVYSKEIRNNVSFNDVEIDSGRVRGFLAPDAGYFAYLGIPYAAPPIGKRRFKAPSPPDHWKSVFIANRTVRCPQQGNGDEDCLIVNVFTPTTISRNPIPVLVYIHGGSFLIGSGQTKGVQPLINQNVIVVTLNYRLGALGFLCLGIEGAPGNAGLKDQVAALEWVQRNINKFGGDPDKVTIYGMSAGGTSVDMLVISEMAKGLFHNAIVESGAASAVWSLDNDPISTAKNLAQLLDFSEEFYTLDELVELYQNKSAIELSTKNYEFAENLKGSQFGFVPCLERKSPSAEPFLTDTFHNALAKGNYNKVPMLYIFATYEGLFLTSSSYYELNYKDKMNARFDDFLPADLIFDSEEIRKAITEQVRWFYFGDKPVGNYTLIEYLDFFGDQLVVQPLLNSALDHSKQGDDVYLMEFAYKGGLGGYDSFFDEVKGAGHGDAVKHAILNKEIENTNDELIVDRMSMILANFMNFANPSPSRSELIPIFWPKVQPGSVTYLLLDKELQILRKPFWERKKFWDKLYEKYRRAVKPVDPNIDSEI